MKISTISLGFLTLVGCVCVRAQTYPIFSHRTTHNGSSVRVFRNPNPPSLHTVASHWATKASLPTCDIG